MTVCSTTTYGDVNYDSVPEAFPSLKSREILLRLQLDSNPQPASLVK